MTGRHADPQRRHRCRPGRGADDAGDPDGGSASLAGTPADAAARAQRSAGAALVDAGVSCTEVTADVDTSGFRAGGQVTVTVSCTADLSGLAMAGVPGRLTLTGRAGSPLETYRQYGGSIGAGTTP